MPRIKQTITFGIELEAVQLSAQAVEIAQNRGFTLRKDGTICEDTGVRSPYGREIITGVLTAHIDSNQDGSDMSVDFGDCVQVVNDLCRCASKVNTSCGIHVHLGRPDPKNPAQSKWAPECIRTFLVLGASLERSLFDLTPVSRRKNPHCKTVSESYSMKELLSYYPIGEVKSNKRLNQKRYCWLNLIETARQGTNDHVGWGEGPATKTVEIRMLGNTRRFNYVWAWTRFWVTLAAYVAYVPTSLAIARYTVGAEQMLADLRETKTAVEVDPAFHANLVAVPMESTNFN
jgi:hypothetical protein